MASENDANSERIQFHRELTASVSKQNELLIIDAAKLFDKVPHRSSVIALRKHHGAVLAGFAVLDGDIMQTYAMLREGILDPDRSPEWWKPIPESKLSLLTEFTNPPDGALAFFALTPEGNYALAFSHLFRSDGSVQWVSDVIYICRVANVLIEVGLLQK